MLMTSPGVGAGTDQDTWHWVPLCLHSASWGWAGRWHHTARHTSASTSIPRCSNACEQRWVTYSKSRALKVE